MNKEVIEQASQVENLYMSMKGKLVSIRETIKATDLMKGRDEARHRELLHEYEVRSRSLEVMKKLVGLLSEKGLQKLKEMLSYGLSVIFEDRKYSIDIEISERGDAKTAELYLIENIAGFDRRTKVRDSIGGGVVTIVSLILRVYFSSVLGLRRIVFLDEALSAISDIYVENLFSFIKQLVNELGYVFVFVTHDVRYTEYADRLYEIENGKPKLLRG